MVSKKNRSEVRVNKHRRIRSRLSGTPEQPRLAVFRSNNHMYAQIIDDVAGNTIVSASTVQADVKEGLERGRYMLTVYAMEPGMVLQQIGIYCDGGESKRSYLGRKETEYIGK